MTVECVPAGLVILKRRRRPCPVGISDKSSARGPGSRDGAAGRCQATPAGPASVSGAQAGSVARRGASPR
jgi:hypothetical protein